MASIGFPAASANLHLPNGTKYGFVHIKPSDTQPYLLLCHGFPSSSYDWRHQINYFAGLGYGVLAPDLLGYGDTDKPSNPSAVSHPFQGSSTPFGVLQELCDASSKHYTRDVLYVFIPQTQKAILTPK